ncbi:MAG: hypothetical protein OEN01_01180 [Candidatus Krumholzibacteria bacterium]|nr:hypothetical protein [Candidatus Krumholzibacteria bacterium]
MKKSFVLSLLAVAALVAAVYAAKPGFGQLYYNGHIVRTVVPPSASPQEGRDALYAIMNGVSDQLAVVAVAPGARGYHGGQWAFHSVMWNTTPRLLTSAAEVQAAASSGDVTITRVPENDFKCPVQP